MCSEQKGERMKTGKPSSVDRNTLPALFPTHMHPPQFWEQLGRAVATFSFLERTLKGAIFVLQVTRTYSDDEIERAYKEWQEKFGRVLGGQLGDLAEKYRNAVKENQNAAIANIDELVDEITKAKTIRNILCHASWGAPNDEGGSMPFFITKNYEVCDTPIDVQFLFRVQAHVASLICDVFDTVTQMGYQFSGGGGPGEIVWPFQH
jgi:hypothetical protein